MRHISVAEAAANDYRSITNDLWPNLDKDKPIIESIESTLSTCDSVWIVMPYDAIQAGRKRRELILPEDVVNQIKRTTT